MSILCRRYSLCALALVAPLLMATACGSADEAIGSGPPAPDGTVLLSAEQLRAAAVEVREVSLETISIPVRVPGTVTTPDTATASLGSVVEGQVGRVGVVVGDRVPAGAALLRIHSHELSDAERDRAAAAARLVYARSALDRSRTLFEAGAVSREEVERRTAELAAEQAQLRRSEEWVRHLSPSGGDVVVRAPRAGVVLAVHVRPGTAVTPGTPLVEIGGTNVLWVTGWVPENTAVRLTTGADVTVTFQALPEHTAAARIVRMAGAVDSLRRAVEVRAELAAVPAGVRPGMFATLLLAAGEPALRVRLPGDAVQRLDGDEVVFVEEGEGRFRPTPVRAAPLGDGTLAVEGLRTGMRVVTRGAYAVRSALEGVEVE
jgi:membrane fusion protein, heavy metal efflux system